MQRIEGTTVSLILEKNQHDKISEIAKRFGIKKAQAHRILLDTGLDAYSMYEGLGFAKLTEITKKARETLARNRQLSII